MHRVTSIILTARAIENRRLAALNAQPWHRTERGLVSCDFDKPNSAWYGGSKYLEMAIWIGAFSELDLDALVSAIRQIDWHAPECVRLYVSTGTRARFARLDWQAPEPPSSDAAPDARTL